MKAWGVVGDLALRFADAGLLMQGQEQSTRVAPV